MARRNLSAVWDRRLRLGFDRPADGLELEPQPATAHGFDDALSSAVIAERFARRIDTCGNRRIRHDPAVPDPGDDLVIADEAARVGA